MAHRAWRLIRSGAMSGAENMALDEALFESVACGESAPVLRVYRWQRPTVTLGYGQSGGNAVNRDLCDGLGIDVVRRITGGRAVLHECEVTYAVISPATGDLFSGGILGNYQVIAKVLQGALADFGLQTELTPARSRREPGETVDYRNICFAAPSTHELTYQGCKLAGSAQKRADGVFLQHGSIPLELDLERLFRIMQSDEDADVTAGVRALSRRIGWINRWMERPATLDDLEACLIAKFQKGLSLQLVESCPTPTEVNRMRKLVDGKYVKSVRGPLRAAGGR